MNIPEKVSGFVWLVTRKACLTQERSQRRGLQICSSRLLCGQDGESNEPLFLHDKTTTDLLHMFLCISGIKWAMPSSTLMMLSSWRSIGREGGDENRWQVLPASIWLTVSKERNSRFFEGTSINCLNFFFFWCRKNMREKIRDVVDLLGDV